MKKLFTFKGKVGEEIHEFGLKKPTRTESEDIKVFAAAMLSKYMSRGVQTRAAVDKYYEDNCDGVMTKEDEKSVVKLREELLEKENELLSSVGEQNKENRIELYNDITKLTEEIRKYNEYYSAIYDNTAEIMSRNKTIDYCFLNLSLVDDKVLFFVDEEDDQKRMLKQFDLMEEKSEDSDWQEVFDKLLFLFTIWFMGAAETEEEFSNLYARHYPDNLDKRVENSEADEEDSKEVESPE